MRRTELLLTLLATLIITGAITINLPTTTAQAQASIAISPILIDARTPKNVGDTFSINITIDDVAQMWGYEFTLWYNDEIANITAHTLLDNRFTVEYAAEVGGNYTHISRGTYNGDRTGITTTTPIAVEKLDFVVTGDGTTELLLDPTPPLCQLASIYGAVIPATLVSGRFSNTETLQTHDVGITAATLSTTSATVGDKITITVTVSNLGDFAEDVTVNAKYNQSMSFFYPIETPKTMTDLASGTDSQATFTWDTAGLQARPSMITINATVTVDDKPSDNIYIAGTVALSSGGGDGFPVQYIYIIVGVAILVIAGIAIYVVRARKSE